MDTFLIIISMLYGVIGALVSFTAKFIVRKIESYRKASHKRN